MQLVKNIILNQIIYVIVKFKIFLENYKSIENYTIYFQKIFKSRFNRENRFAIDILHIVEFDYFLFSKLIQNPRKTICLFDYTINKIKKNINSIQKHKDISVYFFTSTKLTLNTYNTLNPRNINRLIRIQGCVVKRGNLNLEASGVVFRCQNCFFELYSFLNRTFTFEPLFCFHCKIFNSFCFMDNRCSFVGKWFLQMHQLKNYSRIVVLCTKFPIQLKIGDFVEILGVHRIFHFNCTLPCDSFFFKSFVESLFFCKIIPIFDFNITGSDVSSNKKLFTQKTTHNRILLSSIFQNFYLHVFFTDNMILNLKGLDTIGRVICLCVIFLKSVNFNYFQKLFNIILLNCSDVSNPLLSCSGREFEDFYFFTKTHTMSFFIQHGISFSFFLILKYKKIFFFLQNVLSICRKFQLYSVTKKKFLLMKLLIKNKITDLGRDNSGFFLVNIDIKKKRLLASIYRDESFSLLNSIISDFSTYFVLKTFNTIETDRDVFRYNLNIFLGKKCLNITKNNKEHILGFNGKGVRNLPNILMKLKLRSYSKISIGDFLKWKNIINKNRSLKKIKIFRIGSFLNNLIFFSQINAEIRFSGNIDSVDIWFSVRLALESLKSLGIIRSK